MKRIIQKVLINIFARLNQSSFWLSSSWIYGIFTFINPNPLVTVRGIRIRVVLPIDQVGFYNTVKAWETREPETLDWIDRMQADDIFIDVGSSFGTESLYAALKANGPKQIIAFDADLIPSHYFAMNLKINHVEKVQLYFLALSRGDDFINFHYPSNKHLSPGAELGSIVNHVEYTLPSMSLDKFCSMNGVNPNFIKIDVDGFEKELIGGMDRLLGNKQLRSILIEVNEETKEYVTSLMNKYGFINTASGNTATTENLIFNRRN
jgi:FkbM family methyltransferase